MYYRYDIIILSRETDKSEIKLLRTLTAITKVESHFKIKNKKSLKKLLTTNQFNVIIRYKLKVIPKKGKR